MTDVMEQAIYDLGEILLDAKADKGKIPLAIKRILAIPEIRIKDLDQGLPDITGRPSGISRLTMAADMMTENWVKCYPKEMQ